MLQLFGDVATELLILHDGDEGLFAGYEKVEFLAPVDRSKASGCLFYEVNNRGKKTAPGVFNGGGDDGRRTVQRDGNERPENGRSRMQVSAESSAVCHERSS